MDGLAALHGWPSTIKNTGSGSSCSKRRTKSRKTLAVIDPVNTENRNRPFGVTAEIMFTL